MKTVPRYPRRRRNTKDLLSLLAVSIVLFVTITLLTSCAELPLTLSVKGEYGTYSSSDQRGVEIQVDAAK
jgi:hypothetical protein